MPPPRYADLPHANKTFVDRDVPRWTFEKAALAIPADRALLRVFYGVGGQGKTALCRELMRMTEPAEEPSYANLRRAHLDLNGKTKTDPDLLLVWIRNEFAKAGLFMPCFDLALALTWEGTRGEQPFPHLVNPWLGRATKAAKGGVEEGAGGVADWLGSDTAKELLGEAIGQIPFVGLFLSKIGNWAIDKSKRFLLEQTRGELAHLYNGGDLRPAHELSARLPWMLAQDLNHHLTRAPSDRFVLFVDEYERVFDHGGAGARWAENPFDRHMRDFVKETNGLLVVFFSRERLPWEGDPDWRPDLEGNQHLLGGLADGDAENFLVAIPIEDAAVRAAIIEGSRESSTAAAPVFPLMLDLQVEHWRRLVAAGTVSPDRFRLAAEGFEARIREIVERTLRDYDAPLQATLERLAFARRFDERAFDHIVSTFGTGVPLDSFDRIVELSFVNRSPDGFATLHGVMASAIRSMQTEKKRDETVTALFEHFWSRAKVQNHFEYSEQKIQCLVEAAALRWQKDPKTYIPWLFEATRPLIDGAFYSSAESLWRDALSKSEEYFGSTDYFTGGCLNNLALILKSTGRFRLAKPLYERSLLISEIVDGRGHPTTGKCLNNLGELLRLMGEYSAAEPLLERALYISEKFNGANHNQTAEALTNLGVLKFYTGNYKSAMPILERAVRVFESANGVTHRSVGVALNNLASLLRIMGNFTAAKPLFERALTIAEEVDGLEHPSTGISVNNLASLHRAMGDFPSAKRLFQRALDISEKAEGPDHPSTGTCLNNLAVLLQDQGDQFVAKPLLERALAISIASEGQDHPSTADRLNNLAVLLWGIGDLPTAKSHLERALIISERANGTQHPVTGTYAFNLACLLVEIGDHVSAKPNFERALTISEQIDGNLHLLTGVILVQYANSLQVLGDLTAATPLLERAITIAENNRWHRYPIGGRYLDELAKALLTMGNDPDIVPLYNRTIAIFERDLGPHHPWVTVIRANRDVLRPPSEVDRSE